MSIATSTPLSAAFRDVMAQVATPVAVVTGQADGRPHGTTVSAFASLSMDPPMVLISLARTSELLEIVRSTGRFGVNILASTHTEWARAFARKGGEGKFAGVSWVMCHGVPRLPGAGWIAGVVADLADGGDHVVVLGHVLEAQPGESRPLIYHAREFGTHTTLVTTS